jgi:hypothetical protein
VKARNETGVENRLFHAQHLADDQRDLMAVMMYVGVVWGDRTPCEIMAMVNEEPEGLAA